MVSALPARGTHTPLLSYPNLSPTMIAGEQPLSEGKKVEPQLEREPKLDPAAVAAEAEKAAKAATEAERVAEAEKAASAAAEADRAAKESAAKAAAEAERISKEKVAKAAAEAERAAKAEKVVKAEKFKEQGNEKFKHKRYIEAIDLYTKAIGASSLSSSPLTLHHYSQRLMNRADLLIMITCRPRLYRTSIPRQPRGGPYLYQVFPRSARRLSTRQHPPDSSDSPHHHRL